MGREPMRCPAIFGVEGPTLNAKEADLFEGIKPFGFILFARNIDNPHQVKELVSDLKATLNGEPCLVLIDQEGGRVARLRPPHWPDYPSGARFGERYAADPEAALAAMRLNSRLIAADLAELGINVDCLPVLDVPVEGGHDVIGDRAYSTDPDVVSALARAACDGLMEGGVLPVIKHIPGHGRAMADSHKELPSVDATLSELRDTDFAPFKALADIPLGMTGHILFTALDEQDSVTTSPRIIADIIRGEIGFDGLLMSDDLNMEALAGTLGERAARAQGAGCDVALHCNGDFDQMTQVAAALEPPSNKAMERFQHALAALQVPQEIDLADTRSERDRRLALA